MTRKEHRLGVSEENLVGRHLKLESWEEDALKLAMAEIDAMLGIDAISFDRDSDTLHLAYDAARLCLESLETILEKHQLVVSHDWWTQFKEGYYRFVDENIADNAKHAPWSCHQIPPPVRKK
ncbi:cation transporter [Allohahella marinimesophila]|uniref:Cation transporter n=1 Tax=Allohahella marinimesophila TaxID=1054972 RepID=A0ABP7Q5V5_9GAMM